MRSFVMTITALNLCVVACGAEAVVQPDAARPPTTAPVSASDDATDTKWRNTDAELGTREAQLAIAERVNECIDKWHDGCAEIEAAIQTSCKLPPQFCPEARERLAAVHAWSICQEGSVAECQAACDSGRAYTCLTLAGIYHTGVRVPKDLARANAIAGAACDAGRPEGCMQLAMWTRDSDAPKAASLAMRACIADVQDERKFGCTIWMVLLEGQKYTPARDERIAGLQAACRSEQRGEVLPGKIVRTQTATLSYTSGACGRLKDLGMQP